MNSNPPTESHPFQRYRTTDDIVDTSNIPKRLVLDITDEIQQFYQATSHMEGFEYSFDELFNEILMYLSDKSRVTEGLAALRDEILTIHSKENGYEDGEIFAQHSVTLAQDLYAKFLLYGVYTPEGVLPYESVNWIDMNTPILNKFKEKHPLQGGALRGKWQETASHPRLVSER